MVLEIEGINSTKLVNSKINRVPVRDVKNNFHYIECYRLEQIMKDAGPIGPGEYRKICD